MGQSTEWGCKLCGAATNQPRRRSCVCGPDAQWIEKPRPDDILGSVRLFRDGASDFGGIGDGVMGIGETVSASRYFVDLLGVATKMDGRYADAYSLAKRSHEMFAEAAVVADEADRNLDNLEAALCALAEDDRA